MALLPGSPAIDRGDNEGAPEWDQRGAGFPRVVNGTVDIGAFEVQAAESGSAAGSGSSADLVSARIAVPEKQIVPGDTELALGQPQESGPRAPAEAATGHAVAPAARDIPQTIRTARPAANAVFGESRQARSDVLLLDFHVI